MLDTVSRRDVIAYRAGALGLAGAGWQVERVLDVGAQDHPTGSSAWLALRLRGYDGAATLVHSVRAATHLHRPADLGLFAAALRFDEGTELDRTAIGPFGGEIGAEFGAGLDEVAAAMREVMADGRPRTKGELSEAVTPRVGARLAPWCSGCGVHHVQDALFRYATLQAGLTIAVESPRLFRYLSPVSFEPAEPAQARAELVRRLLHAGGPATPALLASWLNLAPATARRWWSLVADELEPVTVDGRRAWIHGADREALAEPPKPDTLRVLGPYDPVTEIADREVLVPDAAARRKVWASAGNPGVVLHDGELVGVWRRKAARGKLTLTVTPFAGLPADWPDAARADLDVIGTFFGANDVEMTLAG